MELLKTGDTVAIAATARKVSAEEMKPAISILEKWGLKVILQDGLYETDHQFAGTDSNRSSGFQKLLDNPKVKAIFCARGGYGTVRMVDKLDFDLFLDNPKWIIGYSDITVLHSHLYRKLGYSSVHGPMPINWQNTKVNEPSLESLRQSLFEGPQKITIPKHSGNLNEEDTEGVLIGGNLSVLYSILGSESEPRYDGKILFLEDVDEYLYHIDRMMLGLKRSGKLENLGALIVGNMSDMKDNTIPFGKNPFEIIADIVREYDYPVVFGFPCGHEPLNLSLIMGSRYSLNFDKKQVCLKPAAQ